jgi:O-antigen/teichoic acid export membrane protein
MSENPGARAAVSGPPSLAQSTALNFVNTVVTLVAALTVTVLLARALGPDRFGLYALVMAIVTFAYTFARLGIHETVGRFVAEFDGRGQRAVAAIVAGRGLRLALITASGATLILAAAAVPLAALFHHPELRVFILVGALTLVPRLAAGVLRNVLRGIQQYHYLLRMNLATSPLWVAACALVVWRGGGITGLLLAGLAIELLNLSALGFWVRREVGIGWSARLPDALRGRLLRYNLALAALILLNAIVWKRSEIFFLGHFHGPDQVAYYAVPFGMTDRVTELLPGALLGVLLPGLTYAQGAGDPGRFSALLSDALRYLAMLTLAICLLGIPLAPAVIGLLYGPRFSAATLVLQILLIATLFGVLGDAASSALLGAESQGWLLKTGAVAAVVSLGLDFALIPRWGALGAALANTASQACWAVVAFAPLWKQVTAASRAALLRIAAAAAVGAALPAGALLFRPTSAGLALAGMGALGVYVVMMQRMRVLAPRSLLTGLRLRW